MPTWLSINNNNFHQDSKQQKIQTIGYAWINPEKIL